jgi:hypothetical protein
MKLYVLISNGGDGSYYPLYVLNPQHIERLQNAYDNEKLDYEYGPGVDGDGFHYSAINVPDGSTEDSLGIRFMSDEEIDDLCKDK